jgi:hypothetical protein
MRTDELIRALAADDTRHWPVGRTLAIAILAGLPIAAAIFLLVLHPRADLASAWLTPRVLLKFAVTLSLAAGAALVLLRLARPGDRLAMAGWALVVAPLLLAMGMAMQMAMMPEDSWMPGLMGSNAMACAAIVPLLALPLLGALLLGLRHAAPTRPALAGAVAGLLAGGLAAALYALHCRDDSPLFVATWYTLAIALVAGLGAVIGRRLLRW